ncbi:MAG: hypothetical protein ACI8ZM_003267 [Crocinitomix sp.]|jgi:hypothetical protein
MSKQISYQVCVNLIAYHYYGETKIFDIKNKYVEYILGAWYSLGSLLFGIWKFPFINSFGNAGSVFEAIKINFTGGNDYTKFLIQKGYSDKINFIWDNLSHVNRNSLDRDAIEKLLEIQDLYRINHFVLFDDKNVQHLRSRFNRTGQVSLDKFALENFLSAMVRYETRITDEFDY